MKFLQKQKILLLKHKLKKNSAAKIDPTKVFFHKKKSEKEKFTKKFPPKNTFKKFSTKKV